MEPRKTSIYREEAIGSLISCIKNTDSPAAQIAAAETIVALQGRFSHSGMPLARAFLLKSAGLDKKYKSILRKEKLHRSPSEEILVSSIFFLEIGCALNFSYLVIQHTVTLHTN